MLTDAVLYKIYELRARLANVLDMKRFAEIGDDSYMLSGRFEEHKREIARVKTDLALWYKAHNLEVGEDQNKKLIVSSVDGKEFLLTVADYSRIGTMRSVDIKIQGHAAEALSGYLGTESVDYQGHRVPVRDAFHSLDKRMAAMSEEIGKLRRENKEQAETIRTLNAELEGHFHDGNR